MESIGDFREKIFVPEIVTVLQDMLCSSEPGARKLADYLLSELAESGVPFAIYMITYSNFYLSQMSSAVEYLLQKLSIG